MHHLCDRFGRTAAGSAWSPTSRHCDPPVRPGFNHAPGILGTHPSWAAWVQRWHDTSTLTPKVRALVRTQMAKAGRWLAADHPDHRARPVDTSTCAAWVAAIDRMAVGDYTQRQDAARARAGARSRRAPRLTSSRPAAPSSATARNGSGSPAASTPPARWPCRAASPR